MLNKIIEDLNLNLKQTWYLNLIKQKQNKKLLLKSSNRKFDTIKKRTLKSNFNHMSGLNN